MPTLPAAALFSRPVPSAGTKENIRGLTFYDQVEGTPADGDGKLATVVLWPALAWKIGHQLATANLGKEFPDDGTGILPASPLVGGNSTLKLASGALQNQETTLDPRYLLVAMVGGPAAGDARKITGWNSATQTLTLSRAWDAGALPVATNPYRLLIDCRYRSQLTISGEYSADAISATVRIFLYDWALDGAGALRKPRRLPDLARQLSASGQQITVAEDIETNNRWLAEAVTIGTRGALGAKVRVVQIMSSGNVDLFASTS